MKNIMVNNLKNVTILLLTVLLISSCKNIERNPINVLELTKLDNYRVKKTKLNDSVTKVYGENSEYVIEGLIDPRHEVRQKWWYIEGKANKNRVEIEYLFLSQQIENQIKIYNNGILDKQKSKFYNTIINNKNNKFDFYFPVSKYSIKNVELDYIISDTIAKRKVREGTLKCKKIEDYYTCNILLNKGENSIMGVVTAFSELKEKDSVSLAADRIFIKR